MLDWLNDERLTYKQNCFYAEFPDQAPQLRQATGNYIFTIHNSKNYPEITQIFKKMVEKNFDDVSLITKEDKTKLIRQYSRERVANIHQSEEYVAIYKSIMEQGRAKGHTEQELKSAIQGYVQYEADRCTSVPNFCLNTAIHEIKQEN